MAVYKNYPRTTIKEIELKQRKNGWRLKLRRIGINTVPGCKNFSMCLTSQENIYEMTKSRRPETREKTMKITSGVFLIFEVLRYLQSFKILELLERTVTLLDTSK